jgi:hypothetical protein
LHGTVLYCTSYSGRKKGQYWTIQTYQNSFYWSIWSHRSHTGKKYLITLPIYVRGHTPSGIQTVLFLHHIHTGRNMEQTIHTLVAICAILVYSYVTSRQKSCKAGNAVWATVPSPALHVRVHW